MVVRRTPGKKIKIIHEGSKDALELTVLHISTRGGSRCHIGFTYPPGDYKLEVIDYELGSGTGELVLHRNSEVRVMHKGGDMMDIQVADISTRDANIRLVDKPKLFRFEWSDRFMATAS